MTEPTSGERLHRPVLRTPTGGAEPQIKCSCGWVWDPNLPPEPEGEDFMRHVEATGASRSPLLAGPMRDPIDPDYSWLNDEERTIVARTDRHD